MDEPNPKHPAWLQEMLAKIPWQPPSHWYNYSCRSCDHRDWIEDIIVDGFPPTELGGCQPCAHLPGMRRRPLLFLFSQSLSENRFPPFIGFPGR